MNEKTTRISQLVVGKGKTVRPTEQEEWVKEYYEVHVVIDDEQEIPVARANALGMIDGWLSQPVPDHQKIPNIDLAEIEDNPWKTFKSKRPAKKGEAGWLFSNTKGVEPLADALKHSHDHKLNLGSYEFRLSGDKNQFIQRRPLKK